MLLLTFADTSKVLKKVSNGLDPDQDRRWSLSGAKTVGKGYQQMTKVALSMINL